MDAAFKALVASCDPASPPVWGARVTPSYSPQAPARPQVVYTLISGPRDYTQDGPDGVTRFRYQTDIYGETNAATETVRDAMVAGMSGQIGRAFAGVRIQAAFLDNEQTFPVPELDTPGPRAFRRVLDWLVTADHG